MIEVRENDIRVSNITAVKHHKHAKRQEKGHSAVRPSVVCRRSSFPNKSQQKKILIFLFITECLLSHIGPTVSLQTMAPKSTKDVSHIKRLAN
jgi:hypothetical protein